MNAEEIRELGKPLEKVFLTIDKKTLMDLLAVTMMALSNGNIRNDLIPIISESVENALLVSGELNDFS